jgi:hypothetical protein
VYNLDSEEESVETEASSSAGDSDDSSMSEYEGEPDDDDDEEESEASLATEDRGVIRMSPCSCRSFSMDSLFLSAFYFLFLSFFLFFYFCYSLLLPFSCSRSEILGKELSDLTSKEFDLRLEKEDAPEAGPASITPNYDFILEPEKVKRKYTKRTPGEATEQPHATRKKSGESRAKKTKRDEKDAVHVNEEIKKFARLANAVCCPN